MAKHSRKRKRRRKGTAPGGDRVGASRKERTFYVSGMHCPACEILIEKKLIGLENVHAVEASLSKEAITIEYEGQSPSIATLNGMFKTDGYSFSISPPVKQSSSVWLTVLKIAAGVIVALGLIIVLQKTGLAGLVTVNSKSALPAFLLLGVVAGFSSCAALIGGLVLSMSKQWGEIYSPDDPLKKRLEPHLLFNAGRLIAFTLLGALLAVIGGGLKLSPSISAIVVIVISLAMILLGMQMLGVRFLRRFQFTMPRSVTRYVADETHFKGRYMPFTMGALTFFVPCGFTITAQTFALLSGNPWQGAMIMLFFALGTLPMLLVIGFSSVKFLEKPRLATTFLKVAGVLVLFFALFNINNQLVVLNAPSLADVFSPGGSSEDSSLPPVVNGKQVLKMEATASGYDPDTLKVRVGVPVRWEIEDKGTSGCTNAILSRDLFEGQIPLTPGKTSVREFTPEKTGRFRFSCWMGMVTGTIEVVGGQSGKAAGKKSTAPAPALSAPPTETGDKRASAGAGGLPEVVDGKQVLKMEASASGYSPDKLKVTVNVPVRWEIEDTGTSGCTSAIKAQSLFEGEVPLTPGKTSVKVFTPQKVGRYRFSCWMGMVEGSIDVVDPKNPNQTEFDLDETKTPGPGGCPCCGS